MNKIALISQIVKAYFDVNPSVKIILAKDLMPQFIEANIFEKDKKNGLPIREILRKLDVQNQLQQIPYVFANRKLKNTNWYFQRATSIIKKPKVAKAIAQVKLSVKPTKVMSQRDEDYVLDLCDEVLQIKGLRQHRFEFLRGDSGTKLPVDIYYPTLKLVVEYREYQHSNAVKHFDKPDELTVSGVHRGEQRKIYDQRRRDVLPVNGIRLIEIDYMDFECDKRNRIVRDRVKDLDVVKDKLKSYYE